MCFKLYHNLIFCSLGYHDQVKQEGPLPRVRDDSARIAGVTFSPSQLNQIKIAPLFLKYSFLDILSILQPAICRQRVINQTIPGLPAKHWPAKMIILVSEFLGGLQILK